MTTSAAFAMATSAVTVSPDDNEDFTKPWYSALIAFCNIIGVLIFFGNALTVIAYVQTPQLQTATNLLICNQSVTDILFSIGGHPFIWFSYTQFGIIHNLTDKWMCLFGLFSIRLCSTASLVAIFLLSLERSVAIFCPFRYYTMVTEGAVRKAIAVSWTVCTLITAAPFFGWDTWKPGLRCFTMYILPKAYNVFVYTSFAVLCLVCTAIMNISIAVVAVKKNRVQDLSSAAAAAASTAHFKVTKMLLKVVGVFYVGWMPYLLSTVYYTITPIEQRELLPDWFLALHDYSKMLIGVNSVINPLIYVHSNQHFKYAFKRLLRIN